MSDTYLPSFFSDDTRGGALTYDQLQARRKIATALATRNRPFPKNIGEGLTYLGESLGEGFADARLAKYEAAQAGEIARRCISRQPVHRMCRARHRHRRTECLPRRKTRLAAR